MIFRALWPILDDAPTHVGYAQLLAEARADLPAPPEPAAPLLITEVHA